MNFFSGLVKHLGSFSHWKLRKSQMQTLVLLQCIYTDVWDYYPEKNSRIHIIMEKNSNMATVHD